ncbi:MAG: patatin-like phospholipase family protein [Rubrivivax sp.]
MKPGLACALALVHLLTAQQASAAEVATEPGSTLRRPKVALVLSGGGARGFAHVGVLRVLRELQVPFDMVVGTSMGSVVGGAFAAGNSVEALEQVVRDTDWESVIADRPPRDQLDFRRREDDLLLPSRIEFGVDRVGVTLPPAAAGNAALEFALKRLMPGDTRDRPVDRLALPFRSVASDLVTGELVELAHTPLFLAMRASLSVPGVFAPVRLERRLLVDGGLVRNLPIDLARAMGAEVVIAVNVGTPLAPESELGSAVGVAQQMLRILTEQNVQRSLAELGPRDLLIAPDLRGVDFMDFRAGERAMAQGALAARQMSDRLRTLAVPMADYVRVEQARLAAPARPDLPVPLSSVQVRGTDRIAPEVLGAQSGLVPGLPVSRAQLGQAVRQLYGRGDLERVEIEAVDDGGMRAITIHAAEAAWAHSRVRIGLELATDFGDGNVFNLGLLHVLSSLNGWGAELRTLARMGTRRQLGTQWWQPLGPGSPWYLALSGQHVGGADDVYEQGRRVLRLGVRTSGVSAAFGRQLGDWGDLHVGIGRGRADLRALVPDDGTRAPLRGYETSRFVELRIDTLDSLAFPVRGQLIGLNWQRTPRTAGTGGGQVRSDATVLTAFGGDDWAGHLFAEWARAGSGLAPLNLGGFLRLSGTPVNSVEGQRVLLARVVLARRLAAMPLALGGQVRGGFSLELGNGLRAAEPLELSRMRTAASLFVSVDTRFGPLFLATGATRHGDGTVYLFLGPIWQ